MEVSIYQNPFLLNEGVSRWLGFTNATHRGSTVISFLQDNSVLKSDLMTTDFKQYFQLCFVFLFILLGESFSIPDSEAMLLLVVQGGDQQCHPRWCLWMASPFASLLLWFTLTFWII